MTTDSLASLRTLERRIIAIRLGAAAFGAYVITRTDAFAVVRPSPRVIAGAEILMAVLAATSLVAAIAVRRARTAEELRRIGGASFLVDCAVGVAVTWVYSATPTDTLWAVLYVLPIEAALRYQLGGAVVTTAALTANAVGRELALASMVPGYELIVPDVVFHAGIGALMALVAGVATQSLARAVAEREEVARRAVEAEREVEVSNEVLLAGVSASTLDNALDAMALQMVTRQRLRSCRIWLVEGGRLGLRGGHGDQVPPRGTLIAIEAGQVGSVVRSRTTTVRRSERATSIAAPLEVQGEVIGVLDVDLPPDAGAGRMLHVVSRLADGVAIVAHHARLLRLQEVTLDVVTKQEAELRRGYGELQRLDAQRRRLLAELVQAQEEERTRIAGEIHDDPLQKLVALRMRLDHVRSATTDPETIGLIERAEESVLLSVRSLRHLVFQLRPPSIEREGLAAGLREHVQDLGLEGATIADRMETEPPLELRFVLYRIAREALANAWKHARAERITVTLASAEDGYSLEVADDGRGFDPSVLSGSGHIGLAEMRERAEVAGGWCRIDSAPGRGTTVRAWVPGRLAPHRGVTVELPDAGSEIGVPRQPAR